MRSTSGSRARALLPLMAVFAALLASASPAGASSYSITPGGGSVTATTAAAGETAKLFFDGTAGQRVSIKLSAVTIGTSGCCSARLSVLKPDGSTLKAAAYFGRSGAFFDPKTLPVDGEYKILIDPEGTAKGSATVTLYDVPADLSIPVLLDGSPHLASLGTPGQNAFFTFDGTAGQRVSFELSGLTVSAAKVSLLGPGGTKVLAPASVGAAGGFFGPYTLPSAGPYKLLFDPTGAATGDATVKLHEVPPDVSGTLVAGGSSQTITIAAPGQNAKLSFSGEQGDRFSLVLSEVTIGSSTCCGSKVSVVKPDGATLIPAANVGTLGGFFDRTVLPANGTYKVVVNPVGTATGSMTLTLYDVPADDTGSLSFGEPHTFTMGTPGQNSVHKFSGTSGKRISLSVSDVSVSQSKVAIVKPDGSYLLFPTLVGVSGAFFDKKTLPTTGTYKVLLDPQGAATGDATLTVYNVPADEQGSMTIGGPAKTISLTTPGQNASVTFTGSAGQDIALTLSSITIGSSGCCSTKVSVLKPDGGKLVFPTSVGTSGATLNTTLPANGTYTIFVDPVSAATGSMTLSLS
jgi:large repetitive protein